MDIKHAKQKKTGTTFRSLTRGDLFTIPAANNLDVYLVVKPEILRDPSRVAVINLSTNELLKTSSIKLFDIVRRVDQTNALVVREKPMYKEYTQFSGRRDSLRDDLDEREEL